MAHWKSITQEVADVLSGASSATANVKKSLQLIAEHTEQAIISTLEEAALLRAASIDEKN